MQSGTMVETILLGLGRINKDGERDRKANSACAGRLPCRKNCQMKGWCLVSRWIVCICSLALLASIAMADDTTDQTQVDAAYARLKAKQTAATQPADISAADLKGLL